MVMPTENIHLEKGAVHRGKGVAVYLLRHTFNKFCFILFVGSLAPDARETCFGPCLVAAAYAAVVDSARQGRATELN